MFGPRITTVFRSRWRAIWWSATVLLTAYCSVPSANQHASVPETHKAPTHHVNPWAKDAK